MRRALTSALIGGAAASGGGTIKLNWSDCGDSSTHGHITSLSPTSVTLGTKTSLVGKGKVDEAIPDATYKVVAKEGFIPVFSHTGDACKPDTIKLPAGAGELDMKGFKCPLSPGNAELDLDLTLSSSIPAKLARITIELTAKASSGDKALCVQIKTAPENLIADGENLVALPAATIPDPAWAAFRAKQLSDAIVGAAAASGGGTIKLTWLDCGDSSTHGHITSLSPTSVTLGTKTSLIGKGRVDEAIKSGTFKVVAKAGPIPIFSHSGDACKPDTIKLPAGTGELVYKGFKCPLSPGNAEVGLDLTLSSSIPAKLARTTIELTAKASSGDKALCVQVKTAPENLIADGENLIALPAATIPDPAWAAFRAKQLSDAIVGAAAASGSGTIKLTWSDCGDSSTHGHITSLSPTDVTLGTKTSLAGKGTFDKKISGAIYKVAAKELGITVFSHQGDACKPGTIKLPGGIGEIDLKGFNCPISAGAAELDLDLSLSSKIPARLARITIDLTATTSSGDKALCMKIKTAPAFTDPQPYGTTSSDSVVVV